jgi:hypothetical protein
MFSITKSFSEVPQYFKINWMKKVSLPNLEKARANPSKFGKSILDGSLDVYYGGRPKSVRWLEAILQYHNTNDLSKAITKLENSFSNRKDTPAHRKELEDLIWSLDNFIKEIEKSNLILIENKKTMNKIITSQIRLSGWIWLIYMKPEGGYVGYVVSSDFDEINWMLELRFPIIQDYISNSLFGCDIKDVDVGIIDYTIGNSNLICYPQEQITEAIDELQKVGNIISNIVIEES